MLNKETCKKCKNSTEICAWDDITEKCWNSKTGDIWCPGKHEEPPHRQSVSKLGSPPPECPYKFEHAVLTGMTYESGS